MNPLVLVSERLRELTDHRVRCALADEAWHDPADLARTAGVRPGRVNASLRRLVASGEVESRRPETGARPGRRLYRLAAWSKSLLPLPEQTGEGT